MATHEPGTSGPVYDRIGVGYAAGRRTDPRIAAAIGAGLGSARSVVNVGAGTGSYEPHDRRVVAVEPSEVMIAQRPPGAAPAVRGVAEALPLPDRSVDVAQAVLTVHHWTDATAGLREMARVAPRQVVFLFDPAEVAATWVAEAFAEALDTPSERAAPSPTTVADVLDVRAVHNVPVPIDCVDGFGGAYWGRPEAYLDPIVHASQSWLAVLAPEVRDRLVGRLADDLASGRWDLRHGHLRQLDRLDIGYRVVVAEGLA